jgi:hypothetical protein
MYANETQIPIQIFCILEMQKQEKLNNFMPTRERNKELVGISKRTNTRKL